MVDFGRAAVTVGAIANLAGPVADVARTASYLTDNPVANAITAIDNQVTADLEAQGISEDMVDLVDAQEGRREQSFDEAMSDLLAENTTDVETTQQVEAAQDEVADVGDFGDFAESADLGEVYAGAADAAGDAGDAGDAGGAW